MNAPAESVVLCEGYYDRAFWAEWLTRRGCQDARPRRSDGSFGQARDPFGKVVARGDFAFLSASGEFIRVRPCNGDKNVIEQAVTQLKERTTQALHRLVINVDTDAL